MLTSPDELKTRHRFADYIYWTLFFAIHFIAALAAISKHSIAWLVCYVAVGICLVLLILKFYCSHCPHYIQGKKSIKCMFFWGIPKCSSQDPGHCGHLKRPCQLFRLSYGYCFLFIGLLWSRAFWRSICCLCWY